MEKRITLGRIGLSDAQLIANALSFYASEMQGVERELDIETAKHLSEHINKLIQEEKERSHGNTR